MLGTGNAPQIFFTLDKEQLHQSSDLHFNVQTNKNKSSKMTFLSCATKNLLLTLSQQITDNSGLVIKKHSGKCWNNPRLSCFMTNLLNLFEHSGLGFLNPFLLKHEMTHRSEAAESVKSFLSLSVHPLLHPLLLFSSLLSLLNKHTNTKHFFQTLHTTHLSRLL